MHNVATLDISETRQALAEAEQAEQRLRSQRQALHNRIGIGHVQTDDAEFAQAVIDGKNIDELRAQQITAPALSQAELRRAINGVDSLIAEAQKRINDCKGAHRRASVEIVRQKLRNEQQKYDETAETLATAWARVHATASKLSEFTGTAELDHANWHQLLVPRGLPRRANTPFESTALLATGQGILSDGRRINRANAQIGAELDVAFAGQLDREVETHADHEGGIE